METVATVVMAAFVVGSVIQPAHLGGQGQFLLYLKAVWWRSGRPLLWYDLFFDMTSSLIWPLLWYDLFFDLTLFFSYGLFFDINCCMNMFSSVRTSMWWRLFYCLIINLLINCQNRNGASQSDEVGWTRVVYCMLASKQFSRPLLTITNLPSQNGSSGR